MWIGPLCLAGALLALVLLSWKTPAGLGCVVGALRPCGTSPNCVCSQDARPEFAIAPLALGADRDAGWQVLVGLLERRPRTEIVSIGEDGRYLHVTCTTALLRFVDDVELLRDDGAGVVHIRSASRVGSSDFGANRKRVEALRAEFEAALAEQGR